MPDETRFECNCGEVFTESRMDLFKHLKNDHDGDKLNLTSKVFSVEEFSHNGVMVYRSVRTAK